MSDGDGLVADRLRVRAGARLALDDRSFRVSRGAIAVLLGETGSGRTTALEVLAGLRAPDAGRVLLDGAAPAERRVGFLDQQHALPRTLTAAECVAVPLLARGRPPRRMREEVEAALDAVLLPPAVRHNLFEELSGGQQQRVGIARALVGRPDAVLLDEPFSELDAATAEDVRRAVRGAAARGAAVVMTASDGADAVGADLVVRVGSAE